MNGLNAINTAYCQFQPGNIDFVNRPGNIHFVMTHRGEKEMEIERLFTAFAGHRLVATGPIAATLVAVKQALDAGEDEAILIFEDATGAQIDFDLRGTPEEVLERLTEHPLFKVESSEEKGRGGPGRPKLGVVSREVSLLPRHWQWLEAQSGGISGALRRLVDEARKQNAAKDDEHRVRDAISRFIWAIAGDLPEFEEATRALFADDYQQFDQRTKYWPKDLRSHLRKLAEQAVSFRARSFPPDGAAASK